MGPVLGMPTTGTSDGVRVTFTAPAGRLSQKLKDDPMGQVWDYSSVSKERRLFTIADGAMGPRISAVP